jgi:hypothetical protein
MSRNDWQSDRPLVVDTDTVLSGLIGGVTRRLLFELDRDLCYPEPSLDEIHRNRGVIQNRAGLSATAIDELLNRLFAQITVVPEAAVIRGYETAGEATSPHPDADSTRQFRELRSWAAGRVELVSRRSTHTATSDNLFGIHQKPAKHAERLCSTASV